MITQSQIFPVISDRTLSDALYICRFCKERPDQRKGCLLTLAHDALLYPQLCLELEDVQLRGSAEYDRLREVLIWNARLHRERSPDCIVRPQSADQVAAIVRLARQCGTRLALRGSGHNYQAAALRDGGVLVDLGGLDRIDINVGTKRVSIGAGVTGGRLIKELSRHGFGFPIGHCADVAASGYILSGGFGWNYGEWGPACINVASIEMVLANGELVTADAQAHPDLFWAARGAGCAFFAAVTGYELILHPLPAATVALDATFEAASASPLAEWLSVAGQTAHETVEIICLVGPDPKTGKPSITVRAIANGASAEEARAKLGSLQLPPPQAVTIAPMKMEELAFAELTKFSSMPGRKRVAADQSWSDVSLGDLLLSVAHLAEGPQASSAISLTGLGGGARTPGMPDGKACALSAGGTRSAGIYALWEGEQHDRLHLEWVAAVDEALASVRSARYVAEADLFIEPGRLAQCFSPDAFNRLLALRHRYDPDARFFSCLA